MYGVIKGEQGETSTSSGTGTFSPNVRFPSGQHGSPLGLRRPPTTHNLLFIKEETNEITRGQCSCPQFRSRLDKSQNNFIAITNDEILMMAGLGLVKPLPATVPRYTVPSPPAPPSFTPTFRSALTQLAKTINYSPVGNDICAFVRILPLFV